MGETKYTGTFVLSILMCVFAGSFQYGYNISGMNGTARFIKERVYPKNCDKHVYENATSTEILAQTCEGSSDNSTVCRCDVIEDEAATIGQETAFAFAVSVFTVGGIIGSFSTGFLVTKFGRKKTQMINMFLSISAAVCYYLSYQLANSYMLILARIIIGAFAGLATGVCPLYALELSPASIRGAVGVLPQLFITIGLLSAQLIAFPQVMGKPELWGIFFALTGVPAVLWLICSPKMVETPRFTLLERGDRDTAERDLKKIRGSDVKEELDEMEASKSDQSDNVEQMSVLELFTNKSVRWQITIIIVSQMAQQLSGINAVFFYTNDIFNAAGFSAETSTMISALVGLENVFMTFVSMVLMDRMGRKSLQVYGYAIMTFFCVSMTICLNMLDKSSIMPYLCIGCVLGYIIGFAIGPGPVPWIWNSEFFNQSARGAAGSVSCALNWTATFIVGLGFPIVQRMVGPYVFIFFATVTSLTGVFLAKFAPETKGKSFSQIEAEFAKLNGIESEEKEPLDNRHE